MIDVVVNEVQTVIPALAYARYKRRKAVELKRCLEYYWRQYWDVREGFSDYSCVDTLLSALNEDIFDLNNSIKLIERLK